MNKLEITWIDLSCYNMWMYLQESMAKKMAANATSDSVCVLVHPNTYSDSGKEVDRLFHLLKNQSFLKEVIKAY